MYDHVCKMRTMQNNYKKKQSVSHCFQVIPAINLFIVITFGKQELMSDVYEMNLTLTNRKRNPHKPIQKDVRCSYFF